MGKKVFEIPSEGMDDIDDVHALPPIHGFPFLYRLDGVPQGNDFIRDGIAFKNPFDLEGTLRCSLRPANDLLGLAAHRCQQCGKVKV